MNISTVAWLTPLIVFLFAAIGWLLRELHFHREKRSKATLDASQTLKDKKALIEEMMAEIDDDRKKEELRLQLDEINTALLGLHSERLRRILKEAGFSPEKALIAEALNQMQPKQVDQLKEEIAELETLPQSDLIWDLLAQASAHYHSGQYLDAKEIYDKILNLSPNNTIALRNRGNTHFRLGEYDEAFDDYNRLLDLSPDDPDAFYIHGIISAELDRYDEALFDFNQALELKPDDPDILNNRGAIYRYLGRYEEALRDFNRSLEISPDDPDTLNNRGITYAYLRKYEEALSDYKRSLEINPENAAALYNMACFFSLRGKTDDTISYFKKAIDKDKKYQEIAKTDKDFDNIRDDPRFKKLIESD